MVAAGSSAGTLAGPVQGRAIHGSLAGCADGQEVVGPRAAAVVVPLWQREEPLAGGSGRRCA